MNVVARRYANAIVLRVDGRLDQDTCEAFRGELMPFVEKAVSDNAALVLDLSGVEYVSSAGLRCFVIASRRMKAAKGRILVADLQPMVAEIFEISHFNLVFQVFPTVREAIGAISPEASSAFEKA